MFFTIKPNNINNNIIGQMTEETKESSYDLVTGGLQGVLNGDALKEIMDSGRTPKIYWGTAPTGKIHIGYIIQAFKMIDIINAGCELTVLIADLHAFLDSKKSEESQIDARSEYYIKLITALLRLLGADMSKVKFVRGTSFQKDPDYIMDMFRLSSKATYNHCKHAGSEVVKQEKNVPMTNLMYPILQALDIVHLKCDAFLGGNDQIKINSFAIDFLPSIGYTKKYTYLMTPMIAGISTKKCESAATKMSSSEGSSKLELLATPDQINKIISKAYCLECDVHDNSLLTLCQNLVFRLTSEFKCVKYNDTTKSFDDFKTYSTFDELKSDFELGSKAGGIHPADFKKSLADFFIEFLRPLREAFDNPVDAELIARAYA